MKLSLIVLLLLTPLLWADYLDQHQVIRTTEMWDHLSSNENIVLSSDNESLELAAGVGTGYFTLVPDTSSQPFDRGLPSWNGGVDHASSGFKVSMRFRYAAGWSPWLTVGYWQNYIWSSYGETSYSAGYINYDNVVLDDFHTVWQWRVEMKRQSADQPSPKIDKLSFFTSDSRTTENLNYTTILADDPPQIFFPTSFVCQYNVDPEIGGSICSPTSTVLAIRSYGIDVDAYDFAVDNYDDYWNIFGIWPRAVQNAARFYLDGSVTRYRTWSDAYDTLAAGGRIVMSVGPPLYSGHLMMLAGFDNQGDPIVHDPARQDGYAYEYSKSSLSHSWFDKGGISYTFFLEDTALLALDPQMQVTQLRQNQLLSNYPNPFNTNTIIRFLIGESTNLELSIYDISGRELAQLCRGVYPSGEYQVSWNATGFPVGVYFVRLVTANQVQVKRITLLK